MPPTRIAAVAAVAIAIAVTAAIGPLVAVAAVLVPALLVTVAVSLFGPRTALQGESRLEHSSEGDQKWGPLANELARSRRYGRTLVLLRVGVPPGTPERATLQARLTTFVRMTDRAWVTGDDLFVVVPESDKADAQRLIERMRSATGSLFSGVSVQMATFPDDAVTARALIQAVSPRPEGTPQRLSMPVGEPRIERAVR